MEERKFNFKSEDDIRKLVSYHDYYGPASEETVSNYLADVRKMFYLIRDDINRIKTGVNIFKDYGLTISEDSNNLIDNLRKQCSDFSKHIDLIEKYVNRKQDNCKHEYHEDGHDSHHTYYVCNKCGHEYKE